MALLNDNPLKAAREGVAITKSLIDTALDLFNGIYLITPFLRYELTAELAAYTNQRASEIRGDSYAENTIF
jgi:hypothetical protein